MDNAKTGDRLNVCFLESERLEICMNNLAKATRDWLSIKALVPSLHLLHMARPSISPGRSVFFEGLRFRRDAAAWSLERKMEWILQRLRFSLRRAYRETIYYHELFDRIGFDPHADFSFEAFSRLPPRGR